MTGIQVVTRQRLVQSDSKTFAVGVLYRIDQFGKLFPVGVLYIRSHKLVHDMQCARRRLRCHCSCLPLLTFFADDPGKLLSVCQEQARDVRRVRAAHYKSAHFASVRLWCADVEPRHAETFAYTHASSTKKQEQENAGSIGRIYVSAGMSSSIKVTAVQSVRLFGWFVQPVLTLSWVDVKQRAFTWRQLRALGIEAAELMRLQPDKQEWLQRGGIQVADLLDMTIFPVNPLTDFGVDLAELWALKSTATQMASMGLDFISTRLRAKVHIKMADE